MKTSALLWACLGGLLGLVTFYGVKKMPLRASAKMPEVSGASMSEGTLGANVNMPKGELVSIEYSRSNMRGIQYKGSVELNEDGIVVARVMREERGPIYQLVVNKDTLAALRSIIKEEKMYAYRNNYQPPFLVHDGYSWRFSARFSDGQYISSSGSNAKPSGEGLNRVRDYFVQLANNPDAVKVEDNDDNF